MVRLAPEVLDERECARTIIVLAAAVTTTAAATSTTTRPSRPYSSRRIRSEPHSSGAGIRETLS
jgi:hypothetical protein